MPDEKQNTGPNTPETASEGGQKPSETAKPATPTSQDTLKASEAAETLGDAGKKALEAERAARKAAEKALVDLQRASEQGQKSTEQQVADLTARFETVERERQRLAIAAELEIPAADHIFLTGTDEATLRQQAEALAAKNKALAVPTHAPVPGQGQQGGEASLDVQIAEARKNGDIGLAVSLETRKLWRKPATT